MNPIERFLDVQEERIMAPARAPAVVWIFLSLIVATNAADTFNVAFAGSVFSDLSSLMKEPWDRALDILAASFSSGPSCVYEGQGGDAKKNELISYINRNNTRAMLWSLFKPIHGEVHGASSGVDWLYVGFEDGGFVGYAPNSLETYPGALYVSKNRNGTWCGYGGTSTNPITGTATGPSTQCLDYDPTTRPWYLASMSGGSIWTEPYHSVEDNALGITAARQLLTEEGQSLGVFGCDYKLSSIESFLVNLVVGLPSFILYIVDDNGMMLAASVPGAVLDGGGNQLAATSSPDATIAVLSIEFMQQAGSWAAPNGAVLTLEADNELWWVQSTALSDSHGLQWNVVVVEKVSCDAGYYPAPERYITDTTEACRPCPEGAVCEGDNTLPFPRRGYWIDRDEMGVHRGQVFACSWETCIGSRETAHRLLALEQQEGLPPTAESSIVSDCWTIDHFNSSVCTTDNLECARGSRGPICGSCESSFTYNSALRECVSCTGQRNLVPAIVSFSLAALLLVTVAIRIGSLVFTENSVSRKISALAELSWKCVLNRIEQTPLAMLSHLDRGMIKVLASTMQLISTISWSLALKFPKPFQRFLSALAFTQLDWLSLDCQRTSANFLDRVLLVSFAPLLLVALSGLIYLIRLYNPCYVEEEEEVAGTTGNNDVDVSKGQAARKAPRQSVKKRTSLMSMMLHDTKNATVTPPLEAPKEESSSDEASREMRIANQHINFALLLSYIVLPPVSLYQFEALSCIEFNQNFKFLRSDTSVSCLTADYRRFVALDVLLIAAYQAVPLIWFVLLFRVRRRLDPTGFDVVNIETNPLLKLLATCTQATSQVCAAAARTRRAFSLPTEEDQIHLARLPAAACLPTATMTRQTSVDEHIGVEELAVERRKMDETIYHLKFLWQDYRPSHWWFDVIDIYRRIVFIAVLPFMGSTGSVRAAFGCVMAIAVVAWVRETSPFLRNATNAVLVIANYQVLMTMLAALIIVTGAFDDLNLSDFVLGIVLIAVNLGVVGFAALVCVRRWRSDRIAKGWKKPLSDEELRVLNLVMETECVGLDGDMHFSEDNTHGSRPYSRSSSTGMAGSVELSTLNVLRPRIESDGTEGRSQAMLNRFLLPAKDVSLVTKVGAGSFGEVFRGSVFGQPVAVKTMLQITEITARAFRAEIMLTATLRHPNIVNFVGACWGKELTCLVLEWVPKGSLEVLISDPSLMLTWEDPLLKIAMDTARGMSYLHGREFYDERDREHKRCILHRDLKPDNCLVTEFLSTKLTDFGSSRAKSNQDDVTMSSVGTPLYCAPEIARGETYSEKVDVYSFGLLLLALAVDGPLLDFVAERYRRHVGKAKAPKQPMRFLRLMTETDWRPVEHANALVSAPKTIASLIVRCCQQDSAQRPAFSEVLSLLEGSVAEEIHADVRMTGGGGYSVGNHFDRKNSVESLEKESVASSRPRGSSGQVFSRLPLDEAPGPPPLHNHQTEQPRTTTTTTNEHEETAVVAEKEEMLPAKSVTKMLKPALNSSSNYHGGPKLGGGCGLVAGVSFENENPKEDRLDNGSSNHSSSSSSKKTGEAGVGKEVIAVEEAACRPSRVRRGMSAEVEITDGLDYMTSQANNKNNKNNDAPRESGSDHGGGGWVFGAKRSGGACGGDQDKDHDQQRQLQSSGSRKRGGGEGDDTSLFSIGGLVRVVSGSRPRAHPPSRHGASNVVRSEQTDFNSFSINSPMGQSMGQPAAPGNLTDV